MDIGKPLGTKSPASKQLGNSSGDPELACRAVVSRTPSRRQTHRQTRAGKCSRAPDAVKPKVGVVRFTGEGTRLMRTFAKRKEIGASLGGRLGVGRGRERAAGRVFQAEGTACAKAWWGALSLRPRNDRGGRWRQDGGALPVLLKGLDFVQWEPLRGIKQSSNMTVCISLLAPQSSDSYPNALAGVQRLTNSRCQHTNGWIPLMSLLLSLEYTPQCRACPGQACPLGWSYSRHRPGSHGSRHTGLPWVLVWRPSFVLLYRPLLRLFSPPGPCLPTPHPMPHPLFLLLGPLSSGRSWSQYNLLERPS